MGERNGSDGLCAAAIHAGLQFCMTLSAALQAAASQWCLRIKLHCERLHTALPPKLCAAVLFAALGGEAAASEALQLLSTFRLKQAHEERRRCKIHKRTTLPAPGRWSRR